MVVKVCMDLVPWRCVLYCLENGDSKVLETQAIQVIVMQ
jgi:hypothetical protein